MKKPAELVLDDRLRALGQRWFAEVRAKDAAEMAEMRRGRSADRGGLDTGDDPSSDDTSDCGSDGDSCD